MLKSTPGKCSSDFVFQDQRTMSFREPRCLATRRAHNGGYESRIGTARMNNNSLGW